MTAGRKEKEPMSIYIDPDKIEEMACELKRFSRYTEEMEAYIRDITLSCVNEVDAEYHETYVREVTREIKREVEEARQLAAEITESLDSLARNAENAASEHRYNSEKQTQMIMQSIVYFILDMPLIKALKGVSQIVKTMAEDKISLTQPFNPKEDYATRIKEAIENENYTNLQKYVDERDAKIASDKEKYKDVKSTGEYLKSLGYVGVREYLRDQKGFDDKQITYKDGKVCINNDYLLDIEGIVLTGHTNYASAKNIEKALLQAQVPDIKSESGKSGNIQTQGTDEIAEVNSSSPTKVGDYWAPPSIKDWTKVVSKLDYTLYKGVADPAKYLRFYSAEQAMIDPVFAGRLAKYAEDHGIIIYVTGNGGKRSYEDQVRAYKDSGGRYDEKTNEWVGGDGTAAKPGTGWHELGLAIDVNKHAGQDMIDLRSKYQHDATKDQTEFLAYGIFKPLTKGNNIPEDQREPWHIQPIETNGIAKSDRFKLYGNSYSW